MIKKAKVKVLEHQNYKGKTVPARLKDANVIASVIFLKNIKCKSSNVCMMWVQSMSKTFSYPALLNLKR
ncbi:hypothetical protein PR048_012411 [Dryococelus australis]|uniref:Uncharacterized protein n=1 Tax=Dryococelus australis TaxID=614101 RepID=A0ABQ9HPC9_9NEOP|nr:hypothetical protein PR048_012411 [Dryococelus australis]